MELDIDEALRYLGAGQSAPESLRNQTAAAAAELTAAVRPRYTYRVFSLRQEGGAYLLPEAGVCLTGATAEAMLSQCDQAVLLACTLGTAFDTMLRMEQARDMARAAILDACGSAWVEAGCNETERELAIRTDLRLLDLCQELWVFGNRISEGMKREIAYAQEAGIPVRYIKEEEIYVRD